MIVCLLPNPRHSGVARLKNSRRDVRRLKEGVNERYTPLRVFVTVVREVSPDQQLHRWIVKTRTGLRTLKGQNLRLGLVA